MFEKQHPRGGAKALSPEISLKPVQDTGRPHRVWGPQVRLAGLSFGPSHEYPSLHYRSTPSRTLQASALFSLPPPRSLDQRQKQSWGPGARRKVALMREQKGLKEEFQWTRVSVLFARAAAASVTDWEACFLTVWKLETRDQDVGRAGFCCGPWGRSLCQEDDPLLPVSSSFPCLWPNCLL